MEATEHQLEGQHCLLGPLKLMKEALRAPVLVQMGQPLQAALQMVLLVAVAVPAA